MEVTLEKTGDLEGRIVVKIQEADYADRVKKELKEIGATRQIPGFRKGHVDMAQLKKRFGKDVKAHVLNDLASDAALKYVEENKLELLGQPIPEVGQELNLDDKDYTFVYEVGFAPAVELKIDDSVVLPFYNIAVSDEMIAEQDKSLRQQAGEQVPGENYEDRALVKGTIMQLNEDGSVKEDGIQVNDGIVAPFLFKSEAEKAKFEGTKVGDKVVFNPFDTCDGNEAEVASMLHIDRDKVEEARGNFEMNIAEFIVHRTAELGEEFYNKVFGPDVVHNEEEYRTKVAEMIAQALQPNSRQLFARTAEDFLMETYGMPMELPKEFLRKFILRTNPEVKEEDVDAELEAALPGIKWEIVESKAADLLNVKVTEEDVKNFARMLAVEQLQQYGMAHMADQMADYLAENMLKDNKQRNAIARRAFSGNLISAIHNAVKLDEKTVSLDEFRAIVAELNKNAGAEEAAVEEA